MRRLFYILLISLAVAGAGCSSKKSGGGGSANNNDDDINPNVPPVTDPVNPPTLDDGATIDFTLVSKSALDSYLGWTTNTPTNTKLIVSLKKYGTYAKKDGGGYDYGFGGLVSIRFKDGTSTYTDVFSSLINDGEYNTKDNNQQNHIYNLLSSDYPELGGAIGYHGFFEDSNTPRLTMPLPGSPVFGGALILVIDSTNDMGDGQGPTTGNGSIWFKNYIANYPMGPLPQTNCWFISEGPYDCRTWKQNGKVNTKLSINPNGGYVKLGTFTGLDMKKAFNSEI